MKKTFKLLLCMLLALAMVLSFVACEKADDDKDDEKEDKKTEEVNKDSDADKEDEKEDKNDGEDESKETLEACLDAFCEFDFKEVNKYLSEPMEDMDFSSVEDMADFYIENNLPAGMENYEDMFRDLLLPALQALQESLEYEIVDVKADGDDYVFEVEISMKDTSLLESAFDDSVMEALLTEMVNNGEITENMSQDEMLRKVFAKLKDYIVEAIDGVDAATNTVEFVVTEVDGEWLIDVDKSDELDVGMDF